MYRPRYRKSKSAVENMTGLEVADVNVKVAGVEMESQESSKIEIHCKRQDSCSIIKDVAGHPFFSF